MTEPHAQETQPKSALWLVFRIFDEPTKVFKELAANPQWLVPIIALVLVSGIVGFGTPAEVLEQQTREQLEPFMENADDATMEQFQTTINDAGSTGNRVTILVAGSLGGTAALAIVALILMLIFGASSAEPLKFKDEFAIVVHANIIAMAGTILILILAIAGMQNVQFSLGFLFDAENGGFLYRLANGITVFGAWNVFALALGNQIRTGGKSIGGPLMIVGGLWLLFKIVVALITGLLAGLGG